MQAMDINQLTVETLKLSCEFATLKSILIEKGVCTAEEIESTLGLKLSVLELNLSNIKDDLDGSDEILNRL